MHSMHMNPPTRESDHHSPPSLLVSSRDSQPLAIPLPLTGIPSQGSRFDRLHATRSMSMSIDHLHAIFTHHPCHVMSCHYIPIDGERHGSPSTMPSPFTIHTASHMSSSHVSPTPTASFSQGTWGWCASFTRIDIIRETDHYPPPSQLTSTTCPSPSSHSLILAGLCVWPSGGGAQHARVHRLHEAHQHLPL